MTNDQPNTAAPVAEQGPHGAPEKAASKKAASQTKPASKARKGVKAAKPAREGKSKKEPKPKKAAAKTAHKDGQTTRGEGKGGKILEMIGRANGASLPEIMQATDWQAHSVRGFISTAAKKHNISIESSKNQAGERIYKLSK